MNKAMTGSITSKKQCSVLRIEIAPERIHFLKFILEGYDGLAILSTVDSRQGIVEIRYPLEIERDLKKILHNIEPQINKNIT
ncbi:MAG: hypothetical protein AMJ61_03540 [Desulfobacterales bacterium SG8_35_2]|nr:MAG: hypothetical protein AMJ61_03540 [Desulfobacterales bacterium SG8_35_2]